MATITIENMRSLAPMPEGERKTKLTQALTDLVKGITAIVIAHRLNTIQTAADLSRETGLTKTPIYGILTEVSKD